MSNSSTCIANAARSRLVYIPHNFPPGYDLCKRRKLETNSNDKMTKTGAHQQVLFGSFGHYDFPFCFEIRNSGFGFFRHLKTL